VGRRFVSRLVLLYSIRRFFQWAEPLGERAWQLSSHFNFWQRDLNKCCCKSTVLYILFWSDGRVFLSHSVSPFSLFLMGKYASSFGFS
jgi:hypothetical protein